MWDLKLSELDEINCPAHLGWLNKVKQRLLLNSDFSVLPKFDIWDYSKLKSYRKEISDENQHLWVRQFVERSIHFNLLLLQTLSMTLTLYNNITLLPPLLKVYWSHNQDSRSRGLSLECNHASFLAICWNKWCSHCSWGECNVKQYLQFIRYM